MRKKERERENRVDDKDSPSRMGLDGERARVNREGETSQAPKTTTKTYEKRCLSSVVPAGEVERIFSFSFFSS